MRILITNDDGINAPGLKVLREIADALAGTSGEVWCVAPAFEQSGVAHAISYTQPMMVSELAPRIYAVQGSPADCILAGLHDILTDTPPDLVLSGVNRGNNAAENAMYSGTLGAAMEAALQGVRAIALSQFYGPGNRDLADTFDAARGHGLSTVRRLLSKGVWSNDDYKIFYNINFPPVSASDVKGVRAVPQGFRRGIGFGIEPQVSPSGRRFLWVKGAPQQQPTRPDTDAAVNLDGYISVTPMRADLTAHDILEPLKAIE